MNSRLVGERLAIIALCLCILCISVLWVELAKRSGVMCSTVAFYRPGTGYAVCMVP